MLYGRKDDPHPFPDDIYYEVAEIYSKSPMEVMTWPWVVIRNIVIRSKALAIVSRERERQAAIKNRRK